MKTGLTKGAPPISTFVQKQFVLDFKSDFFPSSKFRDYACRKRGTDGKKLNESDRDTETETERQRQRQREKRLTDCIVIFFFSCRVCQSVWVEFFFFFFVKSEFFSCSFSPFLLFIFPFFTRCLPRINLEHHRIRFFFPSFSFFFLFLFLARVEKTKSSKSSNYLSISLIK